MRKAAGSFTTCIGNGGEEVDVTFRASQDYDERGVFWDIDWDNVKVYLGDTDITDTLSEESWKQIDIDIHEELK